MKFSCRRLFLWILPLMLCVTFAMAEETLTCSESVCAVGDTVHFTLKAEEGATTCIYRMQRNGKQIFESPKADSHFEGAWRPDSAGSYVFSAEITYKDKHKSTAECAFEVENLPEDSVLEEEVSPIYSQKDGTWAQVAYRKSDLETSGCAIFTLSHALHALGFTGEETEPATLAKTYAHCLVVGGTNNGRLVREAAEAFGFATEKNLIKNKTKIVELLQDGSVFSFSVVTGHIALVRGLSADGKKVLIYDSAPTATFERMKKSKLYHLNSNGEMRPVSDLSDIPGAIYYFETQHYGGLEYYLDLSYVANRGIRLIQPYWLHLNQEGLKTPVELVTFGTVESIIEVDGVKQTVCTRDLTWQTDGCEMQAAYIPGKKAVNLRDAEGKRLARLSGCTVLPVLSISEEKICVRYEGSRGYLARGDAELVAIDEGSAPVAVLTLNGSTTGKAKIKARYTPAGSIATYWTVGTRVAIVGEEEDYFMVEADGKRYWIQKEYLTMEE